MAEGQEPHKPPPDKTRRAAILATVGIVVIMGLAVFYVTVVAPFLRTRRIVADCHQRFAYGPYSPRELRPPYSGIRDFGGEEKAAQALVSYLHWPRWIAPHRETAVGLLGWCGEPGFPTLIAMARDKSESDAVRLTAIHCLALMWPGQRGLESPRDAPYEFYSLTSVPDSARIERLIKTVCKARDLPYAPPAAEEE